MKPKYILYLDDSGSRQPDHVPKPVRADGMDYFALGGFLIKEDDLPALVAIHRDFCEKWKISYPLHSTKIRGRRESFAWLNKDANLEKQFLAELEKMLLALPILGIACVVDRPGYVARYNEKHSGTPWLMCKTAFSILVERAVKYVDERGGVLEIYFEQTGRKEDTDIKNYMKALKTEGMPFNKDSSAGYNAADAERMKRVVLGEPREKTKKFPPIQIADLLLYPMVKGGYEPAYVPYQSLLKGGVLIDSILSEELIKELGIKYSCFPQKQ